MRQAAAVNRGSDGLRGEIPAVHGEIWTDLLLLLFLVPSSSSPISSLPVLLLVVDFDGQPPIENFENRHHLVPLALGYLSYARM